SIAYLSLTHDDGSTLLISRQESCLPARHAADRGAQTSRPGRRSLGDLELRRVPLLRLERFIERRARQRVYVVGEHLQADVAHDHGGGFGEGGEQVGDEAERLVHAREERLRGLGRISDGVLREAGHVVTSVKKRLRVRSPPTHGRAWRTNL